jgi:multidrug efflux pump subunit AcrA (membrane-fusion protein)
MILLANLRERLRAVLPASTRTRHILAGVAILTSSLIISASIFATGPNATPETVTEKAWPVSVTSITPAALAPMFTAFGRIESAHVARIQTDLVASVAHVPVREGDWVAAGDVLIELDTAELELLVTEREADLDFQRAQHKSVTSEFDLARRMTDQYRHVYEVAQNKLARHKDLFAKKMIAQSLLDEIVQQASAATIDYHSHLRALADFPNRIAETEAGTKRAAALLERARIDLDHATIRAPFAGPVLAVLVSPGNHTALGVPLIEIADAGTFEVRVQVPEAYSEALRRQAAAGTVVARWGDRSINLVRFSANVRPGQSGMDAFFAIDGPAVADAAVGRVVSLDVTLPAQDDLVALPVQSIYENDRIYAVSDDRLQAITVERIGEHTTAAGEHRVLVRSPELHAGQRIITTQLPKAISGLRVQPVS